ncbi:MAG: PDZ domain-containing protein [Chitinophaga sp.]|uniref:PDZ domain-containing protein n=1 Tax=Chitinophaga sp. TaxID=1869181 RepID=UPI001B04373A|nr:PDZ domain-containing protein [Chitinophaga sp.]MBO9729110.1 PDZ domain-containing protein [Chitinophaga sp.]
MTRLLQILTLAGFSCFITGAVSAQTAKTPKDQMGEFDEIVIKHKNDKDSKVTVEIKNGDILLDGKKLDEYNDPNLSVFRRKIIPRDGNSFSFDSDNLPDNFDLFNGDDDDAMAAPTNKAMLGVITEKKGATGVTVKTVAKGTAADKAGIKVGDIITAIDQEKVNEPAELFEIIGKHQPADKITVSYIRNSKTNKVIVTLDERKDSGINSWNDRSPFGQPKNGPRMFTFPAPPRGGQGFGNGWYNRPEEGVKLGLQVQDTENDEGAQVIDIATASPAEKAGFQKDDIVTELAGTPVKSASDLSKAYRENRSKGTITATVKRNGQTQSISIKIPKLLNKADL